MQETQTLHFMCSIQTVFPIFSDRKPTPDDASRQRLWLPPEQEEIGDWGDEDQRGMMILNDPT